MQPAQPCRRPWPCLSVLCIATYIYPKEREDKYCRVRSIGRGRGSLMTMEGRLEFGIIEKGRDICESHHIRGSFVSAKAEGTLNRLIASLDLTQVDIWCRLA